MNDELWRCVLQEAGLVIREEPYIMRVPRSQRGGEVVEPLVREQWFVRMQPLAEPALKVSPLPYLPNHAVKRLQISFEIYEYRQHCG